jgi:hypothetical protein
VNTNGSLELLVLRLAVTNSIVDPWIYILLRRETLTGLIKIKMAISRRCVERMDSTRNGNTEEQKQAKYIKETSPPPHAMAKPAHCDCRGLYI